MTSTIFESSSAERIAQLILMLSSPYDGEVVNAARSIGRMLEAEKSDWHVLANAVARPTTTQPSEHYSTWHWRSTVDWCLRHADLLTEWEVDFLHNIKSWRRGLSERQQACLESIRQRVIYRKAKSANAA